MKIGNFFLRQILSSPLHGILSKNTLLIHFTGQKSGRKYTTPVNFSHADNKVWITSQPDRVWWRNLGKNPEVGLTIYGKKISGTAKLLESGEASAAGLENFLRLTPRYAKYFKIAVDLEGNFNRADLLAAAEGMVIIEITVD